MKIRLIVGLMYAALTASIASAEFAATEQVANADSLEMQAYHGGGHGGGWGGGHPGYGGGYHGGGGWHGGGGYGGGYHGGWAPRPGWHNGWVWNRSWVPPWVNSRVVWPRYAYVPAPQGYWQCTAFDQYMRPYSDLGQTEDQAAYDALMMCGGPNYMQMGCYIPPGYCQFR